MRAATNHHCRGVIDATIVERAPDADFAGIGAGYLRDMEWRLGKERWFTDKLPSNFLNLGFICARCRNAKVLHMVRDPMETCFSNLRELFSDANPYSYDQRELADVPPSVPAPDGALARGVAGPHPRCRLRGADARSGNA